MIDDNPLTKVTTLKEGWEFFLKTFRDVIPKGHEYKFEGAWYAGAATYDAIMFNQITRDAEQAEGSGEETVHLNMTDLIMGLHNEVGEFATQRVKTADEALKQNLN